MAQKKQTLKYIDPSALRSFYFGNDSTPREVFLEEKDGKLYSDENCYDIVDGVPIMWPKEESNQSIEFYRSHYEKRSRVVDLSSDYLLHERRRIPEFARSQGIAGRVLEVGCGTGLFAEEFSNYVGFDYSLEAVLADGFEGFQRFVGDAQAIPLPKEYFQFVFSVNVLEHVPNPSIALREIDRILEPGGILWLQPAWNCSVVQTELIPIRSYKELNATGKLRKFFLPLTKTKFFKFCLRVPRRFFSLFGVLLEGFPMNLVYKPLVPYRGNDVHISDCDACASIDVFDAILYFRGKGYNIISHQSFVAGLLSGNRAVIAKKPVKRPKG